VEDRPLRINLKGVKMANKPRFTKKDSQVVKSYYRVLKRVQEFFGDNTKATDWMLTRNMWLGGISPLDMIEAGRSKKLEDWIVAQIDENEDSTQIKGFEGRT
jgi:uncharacterized protein (DUF2384 family)